MSAPQASNIATYCPKRNLKSSDTSMGPSQSLGKSKNGGEKSDKSDTVGKRNEWETTNAYRKAAAAANLPPSIEYDTQSHKKKRGGYDKYVS